LAAGATQVTKITNDQRISERERCDQLSALCESIVREAAKFNEIVSTVEQLSAEAEASALCKAVSRYPNDRLLAIATSVASRVKPERVAALLRARQDIETCAALLSAPVELGITADMDSRVCDALRDRLLDSYDPAVRKSVADTQFAVSRLRHGIEAATATVRRLTGVEEAPATRTVRVNNP
jgi:hypothetical protein